VSRLFSFSPFVDSCSIGMCEGTLRQPTRGTQTSVTCPTRGTCAVTHNPCFASVSSPQSYYMVAKVQYIFWLLVYTMFTVLTKPAPARVPGKAFFATSGHFFWTQQFFFLSWHFTDAGPLRQFFGFCFSRHTDSPPITQEVCSNKVHPEVPGLKALPQWTRNSLYHYIGQVLKKEG